jgi:hypothetical protein
MDVSESGEKTKESALDQWLNRLSPKDLYVETVNGGPDDNPFPIKSAINQGAKRICDFVPDVVIGILLQIAYIATLFWLFGKFFLLVEFLRISPQ